MTAIEQAFERYRPLVGDWDAFVASVCRALPPAIWIRTDIPGAAEAVGADGVDGHPIEWIPGGLRLDHEPDPRQSLAYRAGLYHVLEEVSMLPVSLLDPKPGERILDLCAAPGNKTALIAARMAGSGTVVANDASRIRQAVTRTTVHRFGLVNVTLTAEDGTDSDWSGAAFDRVLVDAPCSCEGTVRKHPRTATRTTGTMRRGLVDLQRALLLRAVDACRPGGRVVYSTCTFAPEENEGVVSDVLAAFPGRLEVLDARPEGLRCSPGLQRWKGCRYPDALRRAVRIWPHEADTGGFFCAVLERSDRPDGPDRVRRTEPGVTAGHADVRRFVQPVAERFGIAAPVLDRLRFRRDSSRYVSIVAADHHPGVPFRPVSTGLSAVRIRQAVPRPTTQGAIALGRSVSRAILDLDRDESLAYVSRRPIPLSDPAEGHLIVRWREHPLGVGFARPEGAGATLESLHPSTWGGLGPPDPST